MERKRNTKQDSQVRQGKYFSVLMFLSMHDSDNLDRKKTYFLHDITCEVTYKRYPDEAPTVYVCIQSLNHRHIA